MKAMILAAGRGERMKPLTDALPKPLLEVGTHPPRPLIVWQIERLLVAGFHRLVINHAWLGHLIEQTLGDGSTVVERWQLRNPLKLPLRIEYSAEASALETAGGIARALPLLCSGPEPFAVVNADVWCEFPLSRLHSAAQQLVSGKGSCWCVLVPNPEHHPEGDFSLENGLVSARKLVRNAELASATRAWTFSGIGVYRPALFASIAPNESARLAPLILAAAAEGRAHGEIYSGPWHDIGTVERLKQLNQSLSASQE